MIPKGFLMALKQVLPALGIKIDHERTPIEEEIRPKPIPVIVAEPTSTDDVSDELDLVSEQVAVLNILVREKFVDGKMPYFLTVRK